jgi:hypothetical protein
MAKELNAKKLSKQEIKILNKICCDLLNKKAGDKIDNGYFLNPNNIDDCNKYIKLLRNLGLANATYFGNNGKFELYTLDYAKMQNLYYELGGFKSYKNSWNWALWIPIIIFVLSLIAGLLLKSSNQFDIWQWFSK